MPPELPKPQIPIVIARTLPTNFITGNGLSWAAYVQNNLDRSSALILSR